jgi:hypothetical protein
MIKRLFTASATLLLALGLAAAPAAATPVAPGAAAPMLRNDTPRGIKVTPLAAATRPSKDKASPRDMAANSKATRAAYDKKYAALNGQPSTLATSCPAVCYAYAERSQTFSQPTTATGVEADFTIAKPTVLSWDHHSLAETVVSQAGTGGDNVIEAGWTVDPTLNGGSNEPHLFAFFWVNGTPMGYNTADFLSAGGAITLGSSLAAHVGLTKNIEWEHFGAGCGCTQGWWLRYDGSFVGVYPDTEWAGAFTSPRTVQNYGETAVSQTPSQTDMGNGDIATSVVPGQGAQIANLNILGAGAPAAGYTGGLTTLPDRWNRYDSSSTSFRYGGPGGNVTVASTTTPSAHDCSGVGTGNDPSGWGSICFYDGIVGGVPVTKIASMEGAAGASCRTNYGTAGAVVIPAGSGTDMIVNTSYKQIKIYANATCTGATFYTINGVGRVTMPAPYANAANLSFIVTGTYIPCATGYPGTAPTC